MTQDIFNAQRRDFLRYGFWGISAFIGNSLFPTTIHTATLAQSAIGKLQPPDQNGIRLPKGFISDIVAYSGQKLFDYEWHAAPDGGAVFAAPDGGWIYVSNSEMDKKSGGAGALRFDNTGKLINAYSILQNTTRNCAGGHTPWQTWLSCEEINRGQVWECDPFGKKVAQPRKALGLFKHEAVAVDTKNMQLYLTEDEKNGCLYRYTANTYTAEGYPDLDDGYLEVAEIINGPIGKLRWHILPDPLANSTPTRKQVKQSAHFNGGEGIWYHQEVVYFTTKGDDRVWAYDIKNNDLSLIYNAAFHIIPVLTGVDNITVSATGELLVAEDGGNMQIIIISKDGNAYPLLQVTGQNRSEITGPVFSPDGSRLYFSSQRGKTGRSEDGITFEISGPF